MKRGGGSVMGLKLMGKNETSGLAKPVSTVTDTNGNDVLRVVDAAPFAYDPLTNSLATQDAPLLAKITELISVLNNTSNANYTGLDLNQMQLAVAMRSIPNLKYLFPLQENIQTATDFSDTAHTGATKTNILPVDSNIIRSVRRYANFSGTTSFIEIPKTCSVKGLAAFTWVAIIEVMSDGITRRLYNESASDELTGRFRVQINADRTITVYVRSQDTPMPLLTCTTTNPLTVGIHSIFVAVTVATSAVSVYVDKAVAEAATITGSLSPSTIIVNSVPGGKIYLGTSSDSGGHYYTPTYTGRMAYAALYGAALSLAQIQTIVNYMGV